MKEIQGKQNEEIRRLQNEISRIRGEHVQSMSRMKSTFQKQIQNQRTYEDAKVEGIRRQANQVFSEFVFFLFNKIVFQAAEQYLYDQTVEIQNENVELRTNLHEIVKQTQNLEQLKQHLEEEQLHLVRQLKLIADLRRIRLDKISSDVADSSTTH